MKRFTGSLTIRSFWRQLFQDVNCCLNGACFQILPADVPQNTVNATLTYGERLSSDKFPAKFCHDARSSRPPPPNKNNNKKTEHEARFRGFMYVCCAVIVWFLKCSCNASLMIVVSLKHITIMLQSFSA